VVVVVWEGGGRGSILSIGGQLVWFWGRSKVSFAIHLPTLITFPLGERALVSLSVPVCHKLSLVRLA
jgi:hypothetical protein